jgi:hypothetical protein
MNPLTQFKRISIPPLRIAPAFVALTALLVVPTLLGEGTQHRDPGPPDVTVAGNFGRMFRNLPPFAPSAVATRLCSWVVWAGFWMRARPGMVRGTDRGSNQSDQPEQSRTLPG